MKNTEKQQGVESVIQMNQKGMFQRTFHLLGSIRIPWHLYVIYTILGVISAKVGLLYLPYLSELKVGNIQDTSVLWMYIGLMALIEEEEEKKGIEAIHNLFKVQVYQELLTLGNNIVSGSLSTVVNIVIFVLGVPKVREGIISMPDLVTFQSYVQIAYNSLQSIPSLYTSLMYYNGELFYIAGLMNTKEEVYERKQSMNIPDEDIVFDQVSFAYDEENVIKEASFTIPKEKFTLLVGQNGSGKTTLFKLMQRFYTPNQGEILFGPHKAEEIHLGQWRQSITYVLQEPKLFNSSIRENIIYGMDREVTEEEV